MTSLFLCKPMLMRPARPTGRKRRLQDDPAIVAAVRAFLTRHRKETSRFMRTKKRHQKASVSFTVFFTVLIFPQGNTASLLHEGSAVTKGTKYVVRTDVLYKH